MKFSGLRKEQVALEKAVNIRVDKEAVDKACAEPSRKLALWSLKSQEGTHTNRSRTFPVYRGCG